MRNIKILKKLNDWSYLIFVLGYDILQSILNMYDIPCDVSFEYCTNLHSTYISSPESEQDKSDYECLQDYVNNHMHEIESEIIELAKKYSGYDDTPSPISIEATAKSIYDRLQYCGYDDVADSSGYFLVKQFENGRDRSVDVYKSTNDGEPHYIIYCSYEDDNSDYKCTKDLSLEELIRALKEISEED